MIKTITTCIVLIAVLSPIGLSEQLAPTQREINNCLDFLSRLGIHLPKSQQFVQVDFVIPDDGGTIRDIDRGWLIEESDKSFVVLNDRFLHRVFPRRSEHSRVHFDFVTRDTPVSKEKDGFREMWLSREHETKKFMTLFPSLFEDYSRYQIPNSEAMRLLHLLISSNCQIVNGAEVFLQSDPIDFEKADVFLATGCRAHKYALWEQRAKCVLMNLFCTEAVNKISDSKAVSVDECMDFIRLLIAAIEKEDIEFVKIQDLRNSLVDLSILKAERRAWMSRVMVFPTAEDRILDFFISAGSIPGWNDRACGFDKDGFKNLTTVTSSADFIVARSKLKKCDVPCRYVGYNPTNGHFMYSVGDLISYYSNGLDLK